jgi:AraC-like DNA-binding protein/mannose-6-phosphate isomerase-like protein (cupin superfamily)
MPGATTRPRLRAPVDAIHASHGLCAVVYRPAVMPFVHTHAEIEMNFLLRGRMTYLIGGRFHTVHTNEPTVFWAGVPHRLTEVGEGTEFVHVTVPVPWLLQLDLPPALWETLLGGAFIVDDSDPEELAFDRLLFRRWTRYLAPDASSSRRAMALLEVEARLRRFAEQINVIRRPPERHVATQQTRRQVEEIVRFLGERFRDAIDVAAVARAVGLNANYAMTIFREACGVSIWEYVLRLRVSEAQRLLISTDWNVGEIAFRAGFGSTNAFYRAFRRHTGCTPGKFRALT